jgi:hypothetical protein
MAVCMEHIICDTLIALLIFDFLNGNKKVKAYIVLYCSVAIHWNKCIIESCIEYILPWAGFKLIGLVVIGTDCTCSRKSNYQSIMTAMANWSLLTDIWHETFVSVNCDRTIVFSEYSVSPNNKTDRQYLTEILLNEQVGDTNGVIRSCKYSLVNLAFYLPVSSTCVIGHK